MTYEEWLKYSLGSARETRNWYYQSRHILGEAPALHRIRLMTQIIRLLLVIIPAERGYKFQEEIPDYNPVPTELLNNMPMP